jgi:hypothetical protein
MARPGFRNHPKFRRLVHELKLPEPYVLGLCECLWSVAYESGDPVVGDETDVELAAGWPGEPGVLCRAMLNCGGVGRPGLIEVVPDRDECFGIHDLYDHAPEYTQRRMKRESERRAKGKTISDLRRDAANTRWRGAEATVGEADANECNCPTHASDSDANGATPST